MRIARACRIGRADLKIQYRTSASSWMIFAIFTYILSVSPFGACSIWVGQTKSFDKNQAVGSRLNPFPSIQNGLDASQGCAGSAKIWLLPGVFHLDRPIHISSRHLDGKDSLVIAAMNNNSTTIRRGLSVKPIWKCGIEICTTAIGYIPRAVSLNGNFLRRSKLVFSPPILLEDNNWNVSGQLDTIVVDVPDDSMRNSILQSIGNVTRLVGTNGSQRPMAEMPVGAWNGHEIPIISCQRHGRQLKFQLPNGGLLRVANKKASGMYLRQILGLVLPTAPIERGTWTVLHLPERGIELIVRGPIDTSAILDLLPESNEPLLEVTGSAQRHTAGIYVSGIRFSHSGASIHRQGFRGMQVASYSKDQGHLELVSGAISLHHVHQVVFDSCTVVDVTGTGIYVDSTSWDIAIRNCKFFRIGASAIATEGARLHPWEWRRSMSTPPRLHHFLIENNEIHQAGLYFPGQAGIFVPEGRNIKIQRNRIDSTPFAAISIGWGWGEPNGNDSILIGRNVISNSCLDYWDCGSIYLLGPLGAIHSKVHANKIRGWKGIAAIYQDHAASLSVESNFIGLPSPSTYGSWLYQQKNGIAVKGSRVFGNTCEVRYGESGINFDSNFVESCAVIGTTSE